MERVAGLRKTVLAVVHKLQQNSSGWPLLLAGFVTLVVAAVSHGARKTNLPPGPRNWPIIGALLEMEPLFHKALEKLARKYGPVVLFRMGVQTLVVVSSPQAAEELLKHKDAEFSDRACRMNRSNAKYTGIDGKVLPFSNYDTESKLHRKLIITENVSRAKMKTYEKLRTQELAVMVEKIFAEIDGGRGSNCTEDVSPPSIDVRAAAMGMLHNVLFMLCFGKRFDSLPPTDRLREHLEIQEEQMKILVAFNVVDLLAPWLSWLDPQGLLKRMRKFYKRHTVWLEMVLERSRQELKLKHESGIGSDGEERSFIQKLLLAQEGGANLTDKDIMATIEAIVTAGLDTTGSQIAWTVLELVRHPTLLRRLQDEIDSVVGKERLLEEADLQAMPFLNAVTLESLRLHPVAPFSFPHVNLKPSTLCGYDIPANTGVLLNIYGICRDPKEWKDPTQFSPDRFMTSGSSTESSETIKANGVFYSLLPFGSGRRKCPGYNLAILMVSRTVGTLVQAFDWAPPTGISREDLSIEEVGPFILSPSPDVYLLPTPRLSSHHVYKTNIS